MKTLASIVGLKVFRQRRFGLIFNIKFLFYFWYIFYFIIQSSELVSDGCILLLLLFLFSHFGLVHVNHEYGSVWISPTLVSLKLT